jgi:hypothetical protein
LWVFQRRGLAQPARNPARGRISLPDGSSPTALDPFSPSPWPGTGIFARNQRIRNTADWRIASCSTLRHRELPKWDPVAPLPIRACDSSATQRATRWTSAPCDLGPEDVRRVPPQPHHDAVQLGLEIVFVKVRLHALLVGPQLLDHVRLQSPDRVLVVELRVAGAKRDESSQAQGNSRPLVGDMGVGLPERIHRRSLREV